MKINQHKINNVMNNTNKSPRVFSGVQPSGKPHIGNYLGAIKRWVAEQDEKDNYFCIVDMHAITQYQDPEHLRCMTRELAAIYISSGLDPQRSTIFVQSQVHEHAELSWVLNCVTPVGWLERMTQYKVRLQEKQSVNAGLLNYPVLQAADILLYDADQVPVGEDQKQHVELARDIAQRFNRLYGETFVIPEAFIPKVGARIRAFDDPSRKMSKSEAHLRGHAIGLVDAPDEIRYVVRRAVTDTRSEIKFSDDLEKSGVNNLLEIYELMTGKSRTEIEAHFAGKGYAYLKDEVAEVIIEGLSEIRDLYHALIRDPAEIERILALGSERASSVANPKMDLVKRKVGFIVNKS